MTDKTCLVESLKRVAEEAELRQFVLSIESGEYFRAHSKAFDPRQRVDRELLRNLQATRRQLAAVTGRKRDSQVLDALLCRVVFACYLFDRKIIDNSYLRAIGIDESNELRDILKKPKQDAKHQLYALFKKLGEDFNGDLFNLDLDDESQLITSKHLEILDHFLQGVDPDTGQGSFWPYDFSIIPIETISAIYEHFLKEEDPEGKKKSGAFYTPRFLAEVILDFALDGIGSVLDKRFLDPACGSGIFLVGLFNRLAEEWKRKNPGARYDRRASGLMSILRDNLFGVDLNPIACRIAAFSLYLALLDQLAPPDIQELQRKGKMLPRLVFAAGESESEATGRTILCGDFFKPETVVSDQFDLVVGNPPWASLEGPASPAEQWCMVNHLPIANRQLAMAFVWKATKHQRPNGRICFVLPHGVLFNHQDKAVKCQQEWLQQHSVDLVLNLADMRFNLFDAAVGPALVIRYRTEAPDHRTARISYFSPKTSWSISQAELISIPPEDRTEIRLAEILADLRSVRAAQVWKERFWGTPRDWKFLDRLSELPPLSDIVASTRERGQKRWVIAEGFKPQLSGNKTDHPVRRPWPDSQLFIEAEHAGPDLFLLQSDCTPIGKRFPWLHRTISASEIFSGPHVLVWYGLRVAFSKFDVLFRHGIRGIHGPSIDTDLLMFLAAYLRSPLAQYFLFHTSAYWGVERKQVHLGELLRVPFPLPDQTQDPNRSREIVKIVATRIKKSIRESDQPLVDRAGIVRKTQENLNSLVYEYFDMDDVELILVEDTTKIVIESILPKRASATLPTLRESTSASRTDYTRLLCDTLDEWAKGGPYDVQGRVHTSSKSGVGVVVLERATRKSKGPSIAEHGDGVIEVLERLQRAFKEELGCVELLRGLKVFDRDTLYLIKPLSQRYWTRTAALNDADEIAAAVLSHRVQEKA
ncbi:MAG TPA: N-6 DNA methylase [Gemmataceae bacterium]|jgi:hypothetical protein|nr:N-6 DNA methylase [Gemmataceae bacterium]